MGKLNVRPQKHCKNEAQRHTTISRPLEDFSPCQLRLRNRMRRCRLSEKRGRRLVLSARGQGNRRDQCVLVLHLATVSNADHQTRQGGVRPDDMGRDVRPTQQLELAKKRGSVLLGFNEPDLPDQANMTVQQALDLWPHLMATGMRVGSPATARDPSLPGSWLEEFIDGAKARGYRVDFVCVHWYGETFDIDGAVRRLKDFLQAVHHKFQLPIWLTEYSLIRWSNPPTYPSWEQQATFASKSIEMFETLPFVERYALVLLVPVV